MTARLYTRLGDDGYTGLMGKGRLPKYDLRTETAGQLDELQAVLGVCRAGPLSPHGRQLVTAIARDLYQIMAELANDPTHIPPGVGLSVERVRWLENATDRLSQALPPLKDFVLPGDSPGGALVNLARAVARRAERVTAQLVHKEGRQGSQPLAYLNRLSSLLFALVRYEDMQAGVAQPSLARVGDQETDRD